MFIFAARRYISVLKKYKMRTILKLLLLLIVPVLSFAQKTVTAASIIQSLNSNQPVSIRDAEITGDLDFTNLNNKKLEESNSDNKVYISTIGVPVTFSNCTFTGKVLGYYNPDYDKPFVKNSTVYNANFTADANFENCTFQRNISFKYTLFSNKVSFAGSSFNEEAEFKYTNFKNGPVFKSATFKDAVVFKYVDFPAGFDFSNVVFEGATDFKYAQFKHEGSFANASFKGGADFKYAGFVNAVNLKGASFTGAGDFKYTTLDDHQTNASELVNK